MGGERWTEECSRAFGGVTLEWGKVKKGHRLVDVQVAPR